jgi:hypothetical protein
MTPEVQALVRQCAALYAEWELSYRFFYGAMSPLDEHGAVVTDGRRRQMARDYADRELRARHPSLRQAN